MNDPYPNLGDHLVAEERLCDVVTSVREVWVADGSRHRLNVNKGPDTLATGNNRADRHKHFFLDIIVIKRTIAIQKTKKHVLLCKYFLKAGVNS